MRIFKDIKISILLTALVMALGSCVFDTPVPEPDDPENGGGWTFGVGSTNCYMYFHIDTGTYGSESRATHYPDGGIDSANNGDFVDGNEAEHKIGDSGNLVLFFDGKQVLTEIVSLTLPEHEEHPEHGGAAIEAKYVAKLPVDEESQLPKYCLLVVNGSDLEEELIAYKDKADAEKTIEKITSFVWSSTNPYELGFNEDGLFVMTNSVYDANSSIYGAVVIPDDAIQYEGEPEDESKIIHVHVERMVAKATFGLDQSFASSVNIDSKGIIIEKENFLFNYCTGIVKDGDDMKPVLAKRMYRVILTGWNMNALERGTYLFKNLPDINLGWEVNDPTNYRSYWAADPWYGRSANAYPWQFRKAVDNSLTYYSEYTNGILPPLLNYNYNYLNETHFNKSVYFPENTYTDLGNLDNRTDVIAGSHLIVCATLETDFENTNDFKANDVYRDRQGRFYDNPKDCFWALVRDFNYALASQTVVEYQYYDWNQDHGKKGEKRVALSTADPEKKYILYHKGNQLTYEYIKTLENDLFIDATIKGGDGKLFPWLEGITIKKENTSTPNSANNEIEIYSQYTPGLQPSGAPYDNSRYRIGPATENDVKSLILEWSGAVDYFKEGRMYYFAPLRINNYACGSIRNAWYKYTLTDVTGIGTSVYEPEDEIVPNLVKTENEVSVKVEIIGWHEFTADVPIL